MAHQNNIVTTTDLQRWLAPLLSNIALSARPNVQYVQSEADLPPDIQQFVLRKGSVGAASAVWHSQTGTVYFIADGLPTRPLAESAFLHELFGHYGVEAVVPWKQLSRFYYDVHQSRQNEALYRRIVRNYNLDQWRIVALKPGGVRRDFYASNKQEAESRVEGLQQEGYTAGLFEPSINTPDGILTAAREYVAHLAEKGIDDTFITRLIGLIREGLRKIRITLQINDIDIRHLIARGARSLQKDNIDHPIETLINRNEGLALGEAAAKTTAGLNFKRWFAGSKIVDENSEPLVVYHGTANEFVTFNPDAGHGIGVHFGTAEQANEILLHQDLQKAVQQLDHNGYVEDYLADDLVDRYGWDELEPDVLREELDSQRERLDQGGRLIPVYLRLTNPIHAERDRGFNSIHSLIGEADRSDPYWPELPWDIIQQIPVVTHRELLEMEANFQQKEAMQYLRQMLMDLGYDGIVYSNQVEGEGESYIVFEPTQIKSIYNQGMFDDSNPNIMRKQASAKWYSEMESVLADKLPNKGTGKSYANTVQSWANKGMFKPEELEWSGLIDWLQGQDKLTRGEVLDWLGENNVRVEEVVKGVSAISDDEIVDGLMERYGAVEQDDGFFHIHPDVHASEEDMGWNTISRADAIARISTDAENNEAKFSEYQVPGGENYKELLITLPFKAENKPRGSYVVFAQNGDSVYSTLSREKAIAKAGEINGTWAEEREDFPTFQIYTSSHWDEPNVLAHVRMNERIGPNGERVLFLEEVQSDWHQQGRKKGYNQLNEDQKARMEELRYIGEQERALTDAEQSELDSLEDRAGLEVRQRGGAGEGVPDAPFKDTSKWATLAMKRIVRYAAENGFDTVAWTPGKVQAERYDLSKQIERITATKNDDGSYSIKVYPKGKVLIQQTAKTEGELSDLIGKELAEKIAGQVPGVFKDYTDLDLKVGGEGMEGFYDSILPAAVNKFFGKAKWGKAKVGEIEVESPGIYPYKTINNDYVIKNEQGQFLYFVDRPGLAMVQWSDRPENADIYNTKQEAIDVIDLIDVTPAVPLTAHALPITPEMRDKALTEGMPLFQVAHHGTPHVFATEEGFPHGRFRLDKIGTGESAQAYGWGVYFAESKDLAQTYKNKLAKKIRQHFEFEGKRLNDKEISKLQEAAPTGLASFLNRSDVASALKNGNKKKFDSLLEESIAYLDEKADKWESRARKNRENPPFASTYSPDELSEMASNYKNMSADLVNFANSLGFNEEIRQGSLYTVDIPDSIKSKLLDWDKPLSEQSEYIKRLLAGDKRIDSIVQKWVGIREGLKKKLPKKEFTTKAGDIKGRMLYQELSLELGSDKAASEYLASSGIPGNVHDGMSQGATGQKYVIWDQPGLDKIALLERNGEKLDAIRFQKQFEARSVSEQRLRKALGKYGFDGLEKLKIQPLVNKEKIAVKKIGEALGVNVHYFQAQAEALNNITGVFLPHSPTDVYINVKNPRPFIQTMGHEFLHSLRINHPDLYDHLTSTIKEGILQKRFRKWIDKVNDQRERELTDDQVYEEFLADFMGDQMTRQEFWRDLAEDNPTFVSKMVDVLMIVIDKLKRAVQKHARDRDTEQYLENLEQARSAAVSVVGEAARRKEATRTRKRDLDAIRGDEPSFMMAGPRAKGATQFNEAQAMKQSGASRDEIWNETGWWEIVPGQWSFEINDSEMEMTGKTVGDLPDIIRMPSLFKQYPEFRNVFVNITIEDRYEEGWGRGSFTEGWPGDDQRFGRQPEINVNASDLNEARSTIIHEIQHAIQEHEGFARGGSFDSVRNAPLDQYQASRNDVYSSLGGPWDRYRRITGEAEARLVQKRLGMTAEQRESEPPWVTLGNMLIEEGLLKGNEKPEDVLVSRTGESDTEPLFQRAPATGTPAFKKWFGDSVVTVDGRPGSEPLVVYHGTDSDFTEFDSSKIGEKKYSDWGKGFYFTPSSNAADYYREEAAATVDDEANAIFAKMEALEKGVEVVNGAPQYPDEYDDLLEQFRAARAKAERERGSIIPAYLKIESPYILEYQSMPDPTIAEKAKTCGHDGIIVLAPNGNVDEIVVFEPTQIKSVHNRGTFDDNNPDIMFQRRCPDEDADNPHGPKVGIGGKDMTNLKDLGSGVVDSICGRTGYPKDKYGHLLNPYNPRDGRLNQGWDQPGTELPNLTSPYGMLEYVVGNERLFVCFDYAIIETTFNSQEERFLVLHSVINSEMGHFIQDNSYSIWPVSAYDHDTTLGMVENALDSFAEQFTVHDQEGWNQDPYYFHRAVYCACEQCLANTEKPIVTDSEPTDSELRFGGEDINARTGLDFLNDSSPRM